MMSVLSSTAMLKQGAARRSANNWSRTSFPMSSNCLIIVELDNCNPFGAKGVRTHGLPLAAIFIICCLPLELKFLRAGMGQKLGTWPSDWK